MTTPAPQKRYEQYASVITSDQASDLELRRMIKDMQSMEKNFPSDGNLKMLLGIAMFRAGMQDDGIAKLHSAVALYPNPSTVNNYVLALRRAENYAKALEVQKQHPEHAPIDMIGIALAGDYSHQAAEWINPFLDEIVTAGLDEPLTVIVRKVFMDSPYGSMHLIDIDHNEGGIVLDVSVAVPFCTVDQALELNRHIDRFIVDRYRDNKKALSQIITTLYPVE